MNLAPDFNPLEFTVQSDVDNHVINVMSVDIEEYFHAHALEARFPRSERKSLERRSDRSTRQLLDLFDTHDIKCTFFVLGSVARQFPELIREMVSKGHEVASHGMDHYKASEQDPDTFLEDVTSSKAVLEDIIGSPILGYRAASFSVDKNNWWVYDLLEDAGYRYSSSLCNGRLGRADIEIPSSPFRPTSGRLVEIPITTIPMFGRSIPTGGGFFRLLPYFAFKRALKLDNQDTRKRPAIFYCHPWEIDPGQPVVPVNVKTRIRHYGNLRRMEKKIDKALWDFSWGRMDKVFKDVIDISR